MKYVAVLLSELATRGIVTATSVILSSDEQPITVVVHIRAWVE